MAISKERFNELLERLSDKDLELVAELMERLLQSGPIQRVIPLDDEPITQDDISAINDAHEAYLKDELINLKDVEHVLRN